MNLPSAIVLAFLAVGLTLAPWHRPNYIRPRRGLLLEAGLLLAGLVLAWLAMRLGRMGDYDWTVSRWVVTAAAYWYAVVGGIGVVRLVLALVPVREQQEAEPGIEVPQGELARGRLIGILERALVLTLVLLGQFGALGFVVAAKALARFRGLDDRDFAEYFLIGTLASLLHAVVVGVGLQVVM
ncbi:MAG TPA: hypothetical protein VFL88_11795 [Gemmatimonadales bacterium]|jgi:hypothetical protein|nr:hypothetical protein [Gemmatimonadales bacterium]